MSDIETICWSTEEPLNTNSLVMSDYIKNINMLDIKVIDGTYAEGVNLQGQRYGIHASGNGDFFNHKIEFELIKGDSDE